MAFKESDSSDFFFAIRGRDIWVFYIGKKRQDFTIEFVAQDEEMKRRLNSDDPLIRRFTAGPKRVKVRIPSAIETKLPAWARIYNSTTGEFIAGIKITATI